MAELVRHEDAAILHRDVLLAHDAVTAFGMAAPVIRRTAAPSGTSCAKKSPAHSSPMMRKEAGASFCAPFVPEAAKV